MKKRTFAWKRTLIAITFPLWIVPFLILIIICGIVYCAVEMWRGALNWVYPQTPEYEKYLRDKAWEEDRERRLEAMRKEDDG